MPFNPKTDASLAVLYRNQFFQQLSKNPILFRNELLYSRIDFGLMEKRLFFYVLGKAWGLINQMGADYFNENIFRLSGEDFKIEIDFKELIQAESLTKISNEYRDYGKALSFLLAPGRSWIRNYYFDKKEYKDRLIECNLINTVVSERSYFAGQSVKISHSNAHLYLNPPAFQLLLETNLKAKPSYTRSFLAEIERLKTMKATKLYLLITNNFNKSLFSERLEGGVVQPQKYYVPINNLRDILGGDARNADFMKRTLQKCVDEINQSNLIFRIPKVVPCDTNYKEAKPGKQIQNLVFIYQLRQKPE